VIPNERLRHHRLQRGWTLDAVAQRLDALAPTVGKKHLGVNGTMVGRWERGERQPRGIYRGLLATLYETTTQDLGLYEPATSEKVLEEMQRRAFLQNIGVTAGFAVTSVAVQPWERLSAALRQPGRLDREIIAELEHVTVTLEALESQVSPKALLGPVVGHLDTVASLLKGSPRPSLRQQLCSIAGETAGLAGWLTWDLEDRKAAGAYFRTGIEAAREADDRALGAYLVGSSCVQPAYRERPHARLRRLEGTTHGFTRTDATPSTQAWLVTLEAEAHALAGDERATLRAMDEADAIMSRLADEPSARRPRVAFFNAAYLDGERGVALARLGRPEAAQDVLASALASLDPEAVKTRPRLLTALATSRVRQGNIEEACQLGADALALATRQEVGPNLQDVRKLRLELEPWRDSRPVRTLDEQLALAG
jgi:transcriptional regulator with XRE-family HTH domain/tetratricopeptide (TPR) repeat protein